MSFFQELSSRNFALFVFGAISLLGFVVCVTLAFVTDKQVLGINAWIKPAKFFISTTIFVWSMGWYMHHLSHAGIVNAYTWTVIFVLGFELFYISGQAMLGQTSHFNISTDYHATMWSLMGGLIMIMTLFTALVGTLFFSSSITLPVGYLWGIRLGILFFVIFAFEGALMGARLSHTVGGNDGGAGLQFLNWSIKHGDLRVAHFVGMHALQILPLVGYFVFPSLLGILSFSTIYLFLAATILWQALRGIPFISG